MIEIIRSKLSNNLVNFSGWKTNKKIVVIESDDWGSIRMPNKQAYESLLNRGLPVDKSPYCRYDGLESYEDFYSLFEVIEKYNDINGNHPIITLNTVLSNPVFEDIKQSNFTQYSYEPFTYTYKRQENTLNSWIAFQHGIQNNFIWPQFHGREHVNINAWLDLLKSNDKIFKYAFNLGLWGLGNDVLPLQYPIIQATFDIKNREELGDLKIQFEDGLKLFETIFGFKSKTFIPNNFIFPLELYKVLKDNNVEIMQGMKYRLFPKYGLNKRPKARSYQGRYNNQGILDLVRNCSFEPAVYENDSHKTVTQCMLQVRNAFFWKRPAIISSHRINFMGSLCKKNREMNLKMFGKLIKRILNDYPNVEFMTSDQLGNLIIKENSETS